MHKRRVYIVADSLTMRAMLESLVDSDGGFRICGSAGHARQALGEIAAARPDIVLLGLDPGSADGLAFLAHAQPHVRDPWCAMQVVIVSGRTRRGTPACDEAFARGAAACFDKTRLGTDGRDLLALMRAVGTVALQRTVFRGRAVILPPAVEEEMARAQAGVIGVVPVTPPAPDRSDTSGTPAPPADDRLTFI